MRTRNEIETSVVGNQGSMSIGTTVQEKILEVLLDIRELLSN